MNKKQQKLMIVAGGTGGHIFPGIAVAEYLINQGWQVVWLGTSDRMEAEVVPKYGLNIRFIDVQGVRGKGLKKLIKAPFMVLKAILQARKIMKQENPDVLLGMGGYVTGPAGLAAKTLGIPLIVHEQNAIAGMSNKLLAKFSNQVLAAFPGAFPKMDYQVVGNPVRESVANIKHEFLPESCRILVVGGSLGAKVLNDELPAVFSQLNTIKPIEVWHQTGKGSLGAVKESYQDLALNTKVEHFINDIEAAYAWADIVVCRSGALTVSEITAAGKMALFVPFPHAVDDHQTANAEFLVSNKAALLLQQRDLNLQSLVKLLQPFIEQPQLIKDMADKAKLYAQTDATEQVANYIKQHSNSNYACRN
ncbi:undecaprenyldiphospho-muramoylpentapeptide beta-N-acetylglucosaminyltransferase [Pseudoalteromonas sp. NBT06-2]|uniref:undecaprenyldiphospho-muramoylpentapeptide beta-N-acetylglucosaminyltransferase n=1 Tax=Pseudoalteromonas sp. NBT06-2 TaxID=2025950 RepID=UPI000BA6A6C2|nr:undecaprenyldiphospho-muramoylpentapeptide beta-N-acetylglucosaminyltransferase [Pseudoalteromonas sp. NBT06-2]PAJ74796.1 undecaprenyldiphospho-muramoylpentapeptide beta-N-acetylglucosaminyltransferase [Pseudoalteromonas sp. NBT06-2]